MKANRHAIITLGIICLALPLTCWTQTSWINYRFQWLNTSVGLSQNTINCLLRDQNGYTWIGTNHGLNRYDGINIHTFSSSDSGSYKLSNDVIRNIIQLNDGNLWIATHDGITVFDKTRDSSYFIHANYLTGIDADKKITGLFEASDDIIFIGTLNGLLIYDNKKKGIIKRFTETAFDIRPALYSFNIWNFAKLPGQVLAFVGNKVYRYNNRDLSFNVINKLPNMEAVFSGVRQIPESKDLLCFGKGVLCQYNPTSNNFSNSLIKSISTDPKTTVESASAIGPNKIFAGVNKTGLHEITLGNNEIKISRVLLNGTTSFAGQNRFGCMLLDSQQNLWIGCDYGVFFSTPNQYHVQHYLRNDGAGFELSDNSIRSFKETNKGDVILGSSSGLSLFNRIKHSISRLELPWPNSGNNENKYSVNNIEEYNGEIWIGGHMGLARINRGLTSLKVIKPSIASTIPNPGRVWGLTIVNDTVWMCTLNGELFCYSIGTDQLNVYKPANNQIFFQVKRYGNQLLIAALGGVYFFDINQRSFNFCKLPKEARSVQVNALQEIDANKWLIGTEGEGIFEMSPGNMNIDYRSQKLSGKVIYSICKDNKSNIWAGSSDGLYKLAEGGRFLTKFTIQDGMQENEFNYGKSCGILNDGSLIIGGINGFNLFNPDHLQQQPSAYKVYLEKYMVNRKTLFHPLKEINAVDVNYNDKLIQFHFTFPDPGMRGAINYYVQLQDDDTTWRNLGGSGDWIFSDLSPGKYLINLKACLAETGVQISKINSFTLTVRPAFYQTFGFRIVITLFVLGIVFLAFYYLYQRQVSANKLLSAKLSLAETEQQLIEANMAAFRAQMNPHFIFNALGSIQNLIFKNEKDASINYLQRFAKIVRYILDKSRKDMVDLEEEIGFLRSYVEMQQLRHQQITIIVHNSLPVDYTHLKIPSMIIQPFIENSIEHAFPDKKEKMSLNVDFMLENSLLKIVIRDNGIGINSTSGKSKNDSHNSFGIEAVKKRISNLNKKYNAQAQIEIIDLSVKNEIGTEVTLTLPVIKTETK